MRILLYIVPCLASCSIRHVEGFDRFTEVCVEGTSLTLIELGSRDWDCASPAADGGQISIRFALSGPLNVPLRMSASELESASWCPGQDGDCLSIMTGELELTAYEEGIATGGSYHFTLSDGTKVEGNIAAQYCEPTSGC